jgi:HPt (histidine-containing phosphotransfer) domain-containing protein
MRHPVDNISPPHVNADLDDDELRDIIEFFKNEMLPALLVEAQKALAADDRPALARLGHQLKGSVGHYFMPVINELGDQIEAEARGAARTPVLTEHVGALARVVAALRR